MKLAEEYNEILKSLVSGPNKMAFVEVSSQQQKDQKEKTNEHQELENTDDGEVNFRTNTAKKAEEEVEKNTEDVPTTGSKVVEADSDNGNDGNESSGDHCRNTV